MRRTLPRAAILYLKKAYDRVPRAIQQDMLDEALLPNLSTARRPLLCPMILRTKHKKLHNHVLTLFGMPHGDLTPQTILFQNFINDYLTTINIHPCRVIANLFVDDVLLLPRILIDMQRLLDKSEKSTTKSQMEWAITQSCGLKLQVLVQLMGQPLPDKLEEVYMGGSVNPKGVTDTKLVERLEGALSLLATLRDVTWRWKLTVRQRRPFVKTFIISKCDYLLYMQLMTTKVESLAAEPDVKCASYKLGVRVKSHTRERALVISRPLYLLARRKRHFIKLISRLHGRATSDNASERDLENCNVLSQFDTICSFIKLRKPPDNDSEIATWANDEFENIHQQTWEKEGNRFSPKRPPGNSF